MDLERMERGIREFLEGLGQRFPGDDLEATPERVARAWAEDLVAGYGIQPDEELSWTPTSPGGGLVLVRDVRFASICVHHLLPFWGVAHIAYLPERRLAGLSKIGRVVEAHGRRLQIQERLAADIVGTLQRILEPRGTLVLLEAEHTCMTLRGARKEGSRMITVASSGVLDTDAARRAEVVGILTARASSAGTAR